MRFLKSIVLVMVLFPVSLFAAESQVVDIDIKGMSCKFCAYSVKKNLSKVPGVEKAEVSIDDKKAHIVMVAGAKADVDLLKKKISEAGFNPVKVSISQHP